MTRWCTVRPSAGPASAGRAVGQAGECRAAAAPGKTKVVYCKDRKRRLGYEHTSFTFLGYTFRARKAPTRDGKSMFAAFLPAISGDALKDKGRIIRRWRINLRTTSDLSELAEWMNPVIRGWMNYYGKFYRTGLNSSPAAHQYLPSALGSQKVQAAEGIQAC